MNNWRFRMTENTWDAILTLLAVMIMADGHVRDAEVEAFVCGVGVLEKDFQPNDPSFEVMIRAWYDLNEVRVRALSNAKPFDAAIMPYLLELSDLPNRQLLLDQLGSIADADMLRDATEIDLLTMAAAFWGLVRTTPKG